MGGDIQQSLTGNRTQDKTVRRKARAVGGRFLFTLSDKHTLRFSWLRKEESTLWQTSSAIYSLVSVSVAPLLHLHRTAAVADSLRNKHTTVAPPRKTACVCPACAGCANLCHSGDSRERKVRTYVVGLLVQVLITSNLFYNIFQ